MFLLISSAKNGNPTHAILKAENMGQILQCQHDFSFFSNNSSNSVDSMNDITIVVVLIVVFLSNFVLSA